MCFLQRFLYQEEGFHFRENSIEHDNTKSHHWRGNDSQGLNMNHHQSTRSTNVYKKKKKILPTEINQPLDNDPSTTIYDQTRRTVSVAQGQNAVFKRI